MRLKFLLPVFLLVPILSIAQYNWQALPEAPKSWRCDDFFFLNANLGWAINPVYSYVYPSQYGRIFKTTDGGNTWQLLKDSSATFYRSIGFADSLTGWVGNLGYFSAVSRDTNVLYQTSDGGITWMPAKIPYPHPVGICGISVVNSYVVYAYGPYYGPAGYLKTTDKGVTWTYKDMSAYAGGLVDGYFFSPDTGFISGTGNDGKALILHTTDGGITWNACYHATRTGTEIVWKLSFPSKNIAYASIENLSSTSRNDFFLKSVDGGITWVEHSFVYDYDEEGIGFINDSVGWIGGDNTKPTYGTIDGGETWFSDSTFGVLTPPYQDYIPEGYLPGFAINRFRRFGDTLMYASGNTVYKLNTRVKPTEANLLQNEAFTVGNYPNPFDRQTTISFQMPRPDVNVMLDIFDISGRRIFSENLGPLNKGGHHIIYNTNLQNGIYFYSISTANFKISKAMIVSH